MSRPAVKFRRSITRAARKLPSGDHIERIEKVIETHRDFARPFIEGLPAVKCINLAIRRGERTTVVGIVFIDMPLADHIPSAEDEILVLRVSRKHAKIGIVKLADQAARQEHVALIAQIYADLRSFVS